MNRTATTATIASLAALTLGSSALAQGTMTFAWDIALPDNYATDPVVLSLWADMDPAQVGFAGSTFDITGNENWERGTISVYDNLFDSLTDDGQLQGDNSIIDIETFQLPPFFNPDFVANDPVHIYTIEWLAWDGYNLEIVEFWLDNILNSDVYTDDFGGNEAYTPVGGFGWFGIPTPSTAAVLAVAGLAATRRRR